MWGVICRSGFQHGRPTQKRQEMRKFGGTTLSLDSENLHLRNHRTFTKGWVMTEQGANAGCEESGEAWEEVGMDCKNTMPCEQWRLCWTWNKREVPGRKTQLKSYLHQTGPWACVRRRLPDEWLTREDSSKCGQSHPWAGDPGLGKKSWEAFLFLWAIFFTSYL